MSVAIIGAGITGLTLAHNLKKRGFDVQVFESSQEVGGVIRTRLHDGWLAEQGPNSIFETSSRVTGLVDDCNLRGQVVYADKASSKRYLAQDGKPVPVPSTAMQFLRSNLLSNKSKMLILKEPFIKPLPDEEEESLADFVRRRLGEEVLDNFVYPFVGGIYSGDPETLSVKHAFRRFYTLEKKYGSIILGQFKAAGERENHEIPRNKAKTFTFKNGLQSLPRAIHQLLGDDVNVNTRVTAVTNKNGSFKVTSERNGKKIHHSYNVVVFCGAAHTLDKMGFSSRGTTDITGLTSIAYPPVNSIALGFRRDQIKHSLDGFGILIPKREKLKILGTQFNSTVFPGRTPDQDHAMLTVFIGGARFPEAAEMEEDELLSITLKDLNSLLGIKGDPVFVHQARWPKAIPQYNIGYGKFLNIMDKIEDENPGFYLAGNYRNGIAVGDCISNSVDLADRITNDFSHIKQF